MQTQCAYKAKEATITRSNASEEEMKSLLDVDLEAEKDVTSTR